MIWLFIIGFVAGAVASPTVIALLILTDVQVKEEPNDDLLMHDNENKA